MLITVLKLTGGNIELGRFGKFGISKVKDFV